MTNEADYKVRLIPLNGSVKAFVSMGRDGYYSIYVNSNLSRTEQKKAFLHELKHIQHEDFFSDLPIRDVERES